MAFQSMMNGAECSTSSNPLNQFLKNSQGDNSLHQDRAFGPAAGRTNTSIRQAPGGGGGGGPGGSDAVQQQFFGPAQPQQMGGPAGRPFDFQNMRAGLDAAVYQGTRPGVAVSEGGGGGGSGAGAAWAQQMNSAQGPQLSRPGPDGASAAWAEQFGRGSPQQMMAGGGGGAGGPDDAQATMPMNRFGGGMGMSMGMGMGMGMMGSYGMYGGGGMASRHMEPATSTAETRAATAGGLEKVRDEQWEAAFKELDDRATESEPVAAKDKGKGKATEETVNVLDDEEDQDAAVRNALDNIDQAIRADQVEDRQRFRELWNAMKETQDAHKPEGNEAYDPDAELAEWERELMQNNIDEMLGMNHPGGGLGMGEAGRMETAGIDGTEDRLLNGIGSVDDNGYPRLGTYRFTANNPYAYHQDPLAEGLRLLSSGGSIADAALLFEVATQREVQGGTGGEQGEVDRNRRERSEAWRRLGEAQAMNERETQAIRALEEAIKIDAGNLEAYMSLAISYTNEGYDAAAHNTLERYIQRAYPHIKPVPLPAELGGDGQDPVEGTQGMNPWASLNRVTSLFLSAAREGNARGAIDPEVQVGLGVLFYSSASYDQAKDCFQAALSVRPNDFLLWNRLGATLANGGKPEEAIQAYHRALELRPTFTRAIYNLSVSCLNLGAHQEAAEHLLSALALQKTHVLPDVPEGEQAPAVPLAEAHESHNLWSTLRRIFLSMDRMDLAQIAHAGTPLEQFKKQGFDF
ncbi:Peroxisomal membrane signal receptor PTS1 [Tilletia horrida]|nr:Peroxisomal membrane signal receptor PTS1 [Tilletia horrida]KAK0564819.1 Peroxisomal membrane signal receptor PTS1 [Tilletia horrida]